jgi:hypothetical protein
MRQTPNFSVLAMQQSLSDTIFRLETMRSEAITKINIINLHRSLGVAEYELVT